MYRRLTDRARRSLDHAQDEAHRFHHDAIGTEHILLGLIRVGVGVGLDALKKSEIDANTIRLEVERRLKTNPSKISVGHLSFTPGGIAALRLAREEAKELRRHGIGVHLLGTGQLLLGLIRENEGIAARVLLGVGVEIEAVRSAVVERLEAPAEGDCEFPRPSDRELIARINLILRGRDEANDRVRITDGAVEAAVELSRLYLPDDVEPVRSLRVIDHAAARGYSDVGALPPELLALEDDLNDLNDDKEAAVALQDINRAADIRDQAGQLEKQIEAKRQEWFDSWRPGPDSIHEGDVTAAVAKLSGVPVEQVRAREPIDTGAPACEREPIDAVLPGDAVGIQRGLGFALLPHEKQFRRIYDHAIVPAMAENGLTLIKSANIEQPGTALGQVWKNLRTAEVIVADVSGRNPNVMYEVGLAHARGRCPILLARDPAELPPELRKLPHLEYEDEAHPAASLRDRLSAMISQFLAEVRRESERPERD